eukprot:2023065-Rhodomonas_salina.4
MAGRPDLRNELPFRAHRWQQKAILREKTRIRLLRTHHILFRIHRCVGERWKGKERDWEGEGRRGEGDRCVRE